MRLNLEGFPEPCLNVVSSRSQSHIQATKILITCLVLTVCQPRGSSPGCDMIIIVT